MTPEQKAKGLIDYYLEQMPKYLQGKLGRKTAKQCALICVDQTIDIIKYHGTDIGSKYSLKYWKEVKQQINKL